jgi:hypothetical protein
MDNSINQIQKGQLSYSLNGILENYDNNSVSYQNEPSNEFCLQFPTGYQLIGNHFIIEKNKHIFFLTNPNTGVSQIGYMDNNDCVYRIYITASCLNFNIKYPILKCVHKISNCSTQIYWTDGYNSRRYLDLENIPYKLEFNSNLCNPTYSNDVDCNQLKLQPNFSIPTLAVKDVVTGGSLLAGTYQFGLQYSDASGNPYTSYYSITNPTPIFDPYKTTLNFNYEVGKSIVISISNLEISGEYQYFNLAVIKTVNDIEAVELVGTYFIDGASRDITYTGQNVTNIRLTVDDIFEKFNYYDIAQDVTAVQDVLIWDQLTSIDRINYQQIASQITLQWQSYKIPATESYATEFNATNLRSYLRDEVYAFEIVFLLDNGKQTDGFHIPGRVKSYIEFTHPDVPTTNQDFIGTPDYYDINGDIGYSPYWKIYNTASSLGAAVGENIGKAIPHEYGEFAYWESSETYPCNIDLWGDLANQPIRHHKFPDVLVSPIFESGVLTSYENLVMQENSVFPLGVKLDTAQVRGLINSSDLTQEQKDSIAGFKIIRGDRGTNKSIIAKGILRNVNEYRRGEQSYLYPNYPYNDIKPDPFVNITNNAFTKVLNAWLIIATEDSTYSFVDPNSNKVGKKTIKAGETYELYSLAKPQVLKGAATVGPAEYDVYKATGCDGCLGWRAFWDDPFTTNNTEVVAKNVYLNGLSTIFSFGSCSTEYLVVRKGYFVGHDNPSCIRFPIFIGVCVCSAFFSITLIPPQTQPLNVINFKVSRRSSLSALIDTPLPFTTNSYRQVFNSPETSFGQPFLGDTLKLENVLFGAGRAHFVQVKNNAMYRLISKEAQEDAITASNGIGNITGGGSSFGASAFFASYQAYLQIYINGILRRNYAYSFNSIASYDYYKDVPINQGIKQRNIEVAQYLIPGIQTVAEDSPMNNWNRESSVYIKTASSKHDQSYTSLPFPDRTPSLAPGGGTSLISDNSRYTVSEIGSCDAPERQQPIKVVSYYASMKNTFINQYGQIYSYNTVDTGFQRMFSDETQQSTVFGGDTFISKFAFKTKLPFFIDNRVNAPDDSDIFYDELGNIAYPKYWHSSRSDLYDAVGTFAIGGKPMKNFISVKAHNFDCSNEPLPATGAARTYYDGNFYLFAYGIPYFYCESSYNLDLRQAFNNKEGDFFPHVSTAIPDDWVQETYVPIVQDNTYYYNVTYSKQNRDNFFTHLPPDWNSKLCFTNYPFRAIYSDSQVQNADNRMNNWLIYRAISQYDFPQNYGKLTSLDGIENKAILARFENKSLLYNRLLTIDTSNPKAAYIGNDKLFTSSPPIDFAETDLGYVGSQNKFLLKIPQGQITIDAKRGQVFLISGTQITDISAFGSGVNRFMTDHLAFEILRWFPTINIDNHFTGIGLHGTYDSKFDRVIISKLDYIPLSPDVKYDEGTQEFYVENFINDISYKTTIYLSDKDYFCNKSWTLSYCINTKSWISFHSYIPNWYIAENNFFYSGINGCCSTDEFELFLGVMDTSTTTTTSTSSTSSTTSTTTTAPPPDCNLAGTAAETYCGLAGTGLITYNPPQRPPGLTTYSVCRGYLEGRVETVSTGSALDACAAILYILSNFVNPPTLLLVEVQSTTPIAVGTAIYAGTSTDTSTIPDGWYFTEEGFFTSTIFHVESGVITEITIC